MGKKSTHFNCRVFSTHFVLCLFADNKPDLYDKKQMADRYRTLKTQFALHNKTKEQKKSLFIWIPSVQMLLYTIINITSRLVFISSTSFVRQNDANTNWFEAIRYIDETIWFDSVYPSLFVYLFQKIVSSWPDCNIHAKPKTRERKTHTHARTHSHPIDNFCFSDRVNWVCNTCCRLYADTYIPLFIPIQFLIRNQTLGFVNNINHNIKFMCDLIRYLQAHDLSIHIHKLTANVRV